LKIGQHLPKLWARIKCPVFLTHGYIYKTKWAPTLSKWLLQHGLNEKATELACTSQAAVVII